MSSQADARTFVPLNIAILTVSDTRTPENDDSGDFLAKKLEILGHNRVDRLIVRDDLDILRAQFSAWIDNPAIEVILSTGGTGLTRRDVTPEALAPLTSKEIPGFGELFRMLSYDEIGTSTIQSRVLGALCDTTLVFALPGSPGACRTAMDRILDKQLDCRHTPCNFAELLPRIKA